MYVEQPIGQSWPQQDYVTTILLLTKCNSLVWRGPRARGAHTASDASQGWSTGVRCRFNKIKGYSCEHFCRSGGWDSHHKLDNILFSSPYSKALICYRYTKTAWVEGVVWGTGYCCYWFTFLVILYCTRVARSFDRRWWSQEVADIN